MSSQCHQRWWKMQQRSLSCPIIPTLLATVYRCVSPMSQCPRSDSVNQTILASLCKCPQETCIVCRQILTLAYIYEFHRIKDGSNSDATRFNTTNKNTYIKHNGVPVGFATNAAIVSEKTRWIRKRLNDWWPRISRTDREREENSTTVFCIQHARIAFCHYKSISSGHPLISTSTSCTMSIQSTIHHTPNPPAVASLTNPVTICDR